MNKTSLKLIGIVAGFLVIFLALNQFIESYEEGNIKWYNLVMIFGMSLLLYYTLFSSKLKPPSKKS